MSEESLWADLRQGARNVAGVTWQVSVCVYILVAARAGRLPFVDLLPEGFEDADCLTVEGERTFVQTKELDAGYGEMSAAGLAEALAHAEVSARGREIVVITDGTLGSQVEFTGWEASLDEQVGRGRERVVAGLIKRGYSTDEAANILRHSRLIRLPYRVRQASEALLAEALDVHPAVAGIAVDRLTREVARASSDQRRTTASTATRVRVSDIDALVAAVQDAVDVDGLDAAVAGGVCAPVSFLRGEDVRAKTFYLGVDGQPGHVAADLDVIRPEELRACDDGLRDEQSVLLIGPSGCGKSVLLWRAARDLVPAARVLRVERLLDADDAASLTRHVRLLSPTETSPVLVVVDDLGRPEKASWSQAASALRELPHVMLLGAARSEDFSPTLLVGATRVVEPRLSAEMARLLSERIEKEGITPRMAAEEAFERSEGLLMEFVALLSTGRRLRQVLGAQVVALRDPGRLVQREGARLVTAAHTLGLSLHADRLAEALADSGGASAVAQVGDAFGVLRDEHIVVREGERWRGLHELRSSTLSELLHESPPPRLGETLARVAGVIDSVHAGWMVRRVAERFPSSVPEVVQALGDQLANELTAKELATLLEGAERADNALYVHAALPVLESRRPGGVTLANLALLSYPRRNQALEMEKMGHEPYDNAMRRVAAIADSLPLRSDYDATVSSLCQKLDAEQLTRLMRDADLVDVLRVLEVGGHHLALPFELLNGIATRMCVPADVSSALLWSRLVAACASYLAPAQLTEVWGTTSQRAEAVCRADPLALHVEVEGTTVQMTRLLPSDGSGEMPPLLPWDVRRPGADNALNEATVASLERIKDACPELLQFEAITVTADGRRYRLVGHEPGHKNMPRKNFKGRETVRQAVGFQAALRRATSSQTWTEVVTTQIHVAAELTSAAAELPLRLKIEDNARRRAGWRSSIADLRKRLAALNPPPLLLGAGPDSAMSLSDQADRGEDNITRVLSEALEAVDRACPDGDTVRPLAVAMGLRDAADALITARARASASVHGQGDVLPQALIDSILVSANLAAALQVEPAMSRRIRADDPLGSSIRIWNEVRARRTAVCAEVLRTALAERPEATFALVEDPSPSSWSLQGRSWVVFAPAEVFDEVLESLEVLDDDDRDKLEHTLVMGVVLSADAAADAGGSFDVESADGHGDRPRLGPPQCMSLGFGYQLTSSASRSALPIPADRAEELARVTNLIHSRAGVGVAQAVEKLMSRSHEAARRRMRQLADPPRPRIDTAAEEASISDQDESEAPSLSEESVAALARLERHVADEEAGRTDQHIVEVLTRGVRGEPIDELAASLLGALASLHFSNLQALEVDDARQL